MFLCRSCVLIAYHFWFDVSGEKKSEKGKKRREIRSIWKKKLIENTHSLVVSEKKFFNL